MLGWHISAFRQADGGGAPAKSDSPQGVRLAVWQAGLSGLDWLDALVEQDKAIRLGGDNYPSFYTLQAKTLLTVISDGPPDANDTWIAGPDDVLTSGWVGRTRVDAGAAKACRPDEWLIVEVWDES